MRTLIATLCLVLASTATAHADNPTQVRLLIITGDHDGSWQETTAALKEILNAAGHLVDVTDQPRSYLTRDNLKPFDLLVLNYQQTEAGAKANPDSVWTAENQRTVNQLVREGTGLVVLHHAAAGFLGDSDRSRQFGQMSGGGRRAGSRTTGPADLKVTIQRDHPVTRGIQSFDHGADKLVHSPRITDGSQVLATIFDGKQQDEPVVWVNHHGKGRVVHNLLGHDAESMKSDGFAKLLTGCVQWAGEKGFRMIFDGKTLDGWEGNLRYWSVENGAIVGARPSWKSMPVHDFLCTVEDFADFELRLEAKVIGQRNSGICVRTNRQRYTYPIIGYEIDMGVFRWGWIYEEGGKRQVLNRGGQKELQPRIQSVLKQGEFNDVVIRCVGNRIMAFINGVGFEFVENDKEVARKLRQGKIGLQLHSGKPQVVSFRNIRVKEIPRLADD